MDHSLPVVFTVKAVYAYMARESGDLTLTKGIDEDGPRQIKMPSNVFAEHG